MFIDNSIYTAKKNHTKSAFWIVLLVYQCSVKVVLGLPWQVPLCAGIGMASVQAFNPISAWVWARVEIVMPPLNHHRARSANRANASVKFWSKLFKMKRTSEQCWESQNVIASAYAWTNSVMMPILHSWRPGEKIGAACTSLIKINLILCFAAARCFFSRSSKPPCLDVGFDSFWMFLMFLLFFDFLKWGIGWDSEGLGRFWRSIWYQNQMEVFGKERLCRCMEEASRAWLPGLDWRW